MELNMKKYIYSCTVLIVLSLCTKARNIQVTASNQGEKLTTQKDFSNTKTELHVFHINQILQAIDHNMSKYQRERCPQTSMSSFPDLPHSSCLLPVNW